MPTNKELSDELRTLRAEHAALKKRVSSFFVRTPEKTEASEKLRQGYIPYLAAEPKLSVNTDRLDLPETILIEGDNLGVLLGLNSAYESKVDVIYIDPPYNTGKRVYTYSDTYGDSRIKNDYREAILNRHSAWLTYMEVRLTLARSLLRDTGAIICAIGADEHAHLRLLMDSIFGEDNFMSNVTWTGALKNNARYVSESSDYMLIYAKDKEKLQSSVPKWRAKKASAQLLIEAAKKIWEDNDNDSVNATKALRRFYKTQTARDIFAAEPGLKMYNAIDDLGKLYRAGDLSSPNGVGANYKVINPNTGNPVTLPKRGWANSEATFNNKIAANEILWNGDNVPAYKRFLENSLDIVLKDSVQRDRDASNKLLHRIIGNGKFSYPKDHNILAEWIDYVTPDFRKSDELDPPVILDFFAGSASTAHAVAELNAFDGGTRTCIAITSNENDIAREVAAARMKAVFTGHWAKENTIPLRGRLSFYKANFSKPVSEPKKPWGIVKYSQEYVQEVKAEVKILKNSGLL